MRFITTKHINKSTSPTLLCVGVSTSLESHNISWEIAIKNDRLITNIKGYSFDDGSLRSTLQGHENVLESYPTLDINTLKDNKNFAPRSFVETLYTGLFLINCAANDSLVIVTEGFFMQVGHWIFAYITQMKDWKCLEDRWRLLGNKFFWHPTNIECFSNLVYCHDDVFNNNKGCSSFSTGASNNSTNNICQRASYTFS
ncbi:hypothetical protein LIER_11485 [Lithospermum erythrorhizon]|uniref:Uncharacterized protein n=1 Tax=Lithospermum erythrorhizon TaxID=34254 RepID=A0AAV3PQG8_LITER